MIHSISRNNLETFYLVLLKGLERALTKTTLGDFWSIEDLWTHIIQQKAFAFYQEESGYAGVFSFIESPKQRGLYFFWSGKDVENDVPVDYQEVDLYLTEAAKHFDCKFIQCEGRKGWSHILLPLGYIVDSVNYTKEVRHEVPPI